MKPRMKIEDEILYMYDFASRTTVFEYELNTLLKSTFVRRLGNSYRQRYKAAFFASGKVYRT